MRPSVAKVFDLRARNARTGDRGQASVAPCLRNALGGDFSLSQSPVAPERERPRYRVEGGGGDRDADQPAASPLILVRGFVQGFNSAPLSVISVVEVEPNHIHKPFPRTVIGGFP